MQVEFVLGKWDRDEMPIVNKKIGLSVEVIESFASTGLERTMNAYNKMDIA